jgi:large subunit ribosomal protein L3
MPKALVGRKLGMTQVFTDAGEVLPVTVIEAGPCVVMQVKTVEGKDRQNGLVLGFADKKRSRARRPELGLARKVGTEPKQVLRQVACDDPASFTVGQQLTVDIFREVVAVDVVGTSKGRGFQGVVKRWGAKGGPASHGSMSHRRIGSAGTSTTPGRSLRGAHFPGRMGGDRVTARHLQLVRVDTGRGLLLVGGSVPGPVGGLVLVQESGKAARSRHHHPHVV